MGPAERRLQDKARARVAERREDRPQGQDRRRRVRRVERSSVPPRRRRDGHGRESPDRRGAPHVPRGDRRAADVSSGARRRPAGVDAGLQRRGRLPHHRRQDRGVGAQFRDLARRPAGRRRRGGAQHAARRQDGDPERGPPRHRQLHRMQERRGEEGLGADRRRLRQLDHRRRLHVDLLPEREQQRPRHRRVHESRRRRRPLGDPVGHRRAARGQDVPGAGPHAAHRRGRARVRRPRHAVRHDRERVAHVPADGPDTGFQPLLGVHVPRRLRLQPRVDQPDEVRGSRARVRHRGVHGRRADDHHRAGDHGRQRQLPHAGDRAEQPTTTGPSGSGTATSARS